MPGVPREAGTFSISEPMQPGDGITANDTRWIRRLVITQSERAELRIHCRHADRRHRELLEAVVLRVHPKPDE